MSGSESPPISRVSFTLNGEPVELDIEPTRTVLELLRTHFEVPSMRRGCCAGVCGACIILIEDRALPACIVPAYRANGRRITTIEGFRHTREYRDIRRAFHEVGVQACSYCEPARMLIVQSILSAGLTPRSEEVQQAVDAVKCACFAGPAMAEAVWEAAGIRNRRLHARKR